MKLADILYSYKFLS